jgi:hypothetical protein
VRSLRGTGLWLALASAGVLAGLSGCATSGAPSPFDADRTPNRLEIRVDNISFSDATIFAVTPARRTRLGIVSGKSSRRFTLEWESLQEIQIEVDLLASQRFVSPSFAIAPGEFLEVQVQEPVSNTQVTRRTRR